MTDWTDWVFCKYEDGCRRITRAVKQVFGYLMIFAALLALLVLAVAFSPAFLVGLFPKKKGSSDAN